MAGYGRLCHSIAHDLGGGLQEARHRVGGHPHQGTAAPASCAAGDRNDPAARERARLGPKASMHGRVASWASGLTQGNSAMCGDLRQHLAALGVPGGSPAGAVLEQEIVTLDRIIAWRFKTVSWHLAQARRVRGPSSPDRQAGRPCGGAGAGAEDQR